MESIKVGVTLSLLFSVHLVACRPINSNLVSALKPSNGGAHRGLQHLAASQDDGEEWTRQGYYIVVFNDEAQDLTLETQRLFNHVRTARRGSGAGGEGEVNTAADVLPFGVEGALGGTITAQKHVMQAAHMAMAAASTAEQPTAATMAIAAESAKSDQAAPVDDATLQITTLAGTVDGGLQTATAASAATPTAAHKGVMGLVVKLNEGAEDKEEVLQQLRSAQNVKSVVPDLVLQPQVTRLFPTQTAPACVEAQYLSSGLTATAASTFSWPGCKTTANKLIWVAQRCGTDYSQIFYTAVYAVKKTNPPTIARMSNGTLCVLRRNDYADAKWNAVRFGSKCGAAPTSAAKTLPIRVCSATSAPTTPDCIMASSSPANPAAAISATATLKTLLTCGSTSSQFVTYYGSACGPAGQFVQWNQAVVGSCALLPKDTKLDPSAVKFNMDTFGDCGVPPGSLATALSTTLCGNLNNGGGQISPAPAPLQPPPLEIPSGVLPRVALAQNDNLTKNLIRIEAGSQTSGVVNLAGLPVERQITVAVMDSGVDRTHPDLNVVAGGVSYATAAAGASADSENDPTQDLYGHGTHVSGVIGAKNNGVGLVGIAPGVPIVSVKITNSKGGATLSGLVSGLNWILGPEGQAQNIGVINLSMGIQLSPFDQLTYNLVCPLMDQLESSGVTIVASAGNDGQSMKEFFPSEYCNSVVAVTALDASDKNDVRPIGVPAAFSNWLPADASLADMRARVISAPGSFINSTMSYAKDSTGYMQLSGTSMAAPHVAGVVANCIMSGVCERSSPGLQKLAKVQQAAAERLLMANAPAFGFPGDATSIANGKYYGYLVYAGKF